MLPCGCIVFSSSFSLTHLPSFLYTCPLTSVLGILALHSASISYYTLLSISDLFLMLGIFFYPKERNGTLL
jgi:hypothetical protein